MSVIYHKASVQYSIIYIQQAKNRLVYLVTNLIDYEQQLTQFDVEKICDIRQPWFDHSFDNKYNYSSAELRF